MNVIKLTSDAKYSHMYDFDTNTIFSFTSIHVGYRHVGYRHLGYRHVGYRHVGYRHVGYRHVGYRHVRYRHVGYRHVGYKHCYDISLHNQFTHQHTDVKPIRSDSY